MKRVKVIRDERGYHIGYDMLNGNEYDVIGTKDDGDKILIQLTPNANYSGHYGSGYILDDGRHTDDMNLKNVFWVQKQSVEIIEAEFPKNMISYGPSTAILIVNFVKECKGTVIFCSGGSAFDVGDDRLCWGMEHFKDLTDEEYNKYIKKENYEMQYKMIRQITAKALLEDYACSDEFQMYIDKFGPYSEISWNEEVEEYVLDVDARLTFLLEKGYIERIEDDLNTFNNKKHYYLIIDTKFWKICKTRNNYFNLHCLTNPYDGSWSTENKSWKGIIKLIDNISLEKSEIKTFDSFFEAVDWFNSYR